MSLIGNKTGQRSSVLPKILLGVALALIAGSVFLLREPGTDKPELLREWKRRDEEVTRLFYEQLNLQLGESIYILARDSTKTGAAISLLKKRAVRTGKDTAVYQEPVGNSEPTAFVLNDQELLFLLTPSHSPMSLQGRPPLQRPGIGRSVLQTLEPVENDYFRAENARNTDATTEVEEIPRPSHRSKQAPVLVQVVWKEAGEQAQVTHKPVDVEGYDLYKLHKALTPYGLFWVRPDTQRLRRIHPKQSDKHPYTEMQPQDCLMFTPFDGKPVVVKRDCAISDLIYVDNVIRFAEAGVYPVEVSTRYEVPADNSAPPVKLLMPPLAKQVNIWPRSNPVREIVSKGTSTLRLGERIYWLKRDDNGEDARASNAVAGVPGGFPSSSMDGMMWGGTNDERVPTVLMSARPDGSDVRAESPLRDSEGVATEPRLFLEKGKFYLLYSHPFDPNEKRINAGLRPPIYLARLYPERSGDVLGKPVFVTDRSDFNLGPQAVYGDYLYFGTVISKTDTLDVLSDKSTEHLSYESWRVRLPE